VRHMLEAVLPPSYWPLTDQWHYPRIHQSSLAQRRSHQPACILLLWLRKTRSGKYHEAGAKPVPERQRQEGCVTATRDDACVCLRADTVHNFVCSSKRSRTCLMSAVSPMCQLRVAINRVMTCRLMAVENCWNIVPISDSISFQYPARHRSNIRPHTVPILGHNLLNYLNTFGLTTVQRLTTPSFTTPSLQRCTTSAS
jgi:hypothetical protein